MDRVTLANLVDDVPNEAWPQVARLLRQVAHDLNTPLSTLGMELFSAKILLAKVQPGTDEVLPPESASAVSNLAEVCQNLERVASSLTEYAAVLSGLSATDSRRVDST